VNQDNISLSTMDTGQLLDLFGSGSTAGTGAQPQQQQQQAVGRGLQAVLAGAGELWDEREYEEQFDVGAFISKVTSAAQRQAQQQ
jgi:TATA-binding protein-associated factor